MLETRICADCEARPLAPNARFCSYCGHPFDAPEPPAEVPDSVEAAHDEAPAAGRHRGVLVPAILFAAVLVVVGSVLVDRDGSTVWPGEVVVGTAVDIARGIAETGEPVLLPSEDRARVAIVTWDRDDPRSDVLYGELSAIVDEQTGLIALSLVDPHGGHETRWCAASGLFESPAHGELYDWLGEWVAGPGPRGLDRFASRVDDAGDLVVDLGWLVAGPSRDARLSRFAVWIDPNTGASVGASPAFGTRLLDLDAPGAVPRCFD